MVTAIVATRETSTLPDIAGNMWVPLNFYLGLLDLGIDAYWVDFYNPVDAYAGVHSQAYNEALFNRTALEFGFEDKYAIASLQDSERTPAGMDHQRVTELLNDADIVFNIGGDPQIAPYVSGARNRVFVDIDPGFTQIWASQLDFALDAYSAYYTIGQNIPGAASAIPNLGVEWRTFLPPVRLKEWPAQFDSECRRISTLSDWRGSQEALFEGQYYGGKREEFVRCLYVPRGANVEIEIALGIGQGDYEDLGLLLGHKWIARDPYLYAGNLHSYREYIQRSRAEFSVAKRGYVRLGVGWISDRTACYLASGKPAIVQSTGIEDHLPTGSGLLTFSTPEEAITAIHEMNENYEMHSQQARQIAERYFDAGHVLGKMLDELGI